MVSIQLLKLLVDHALKSRAFVINMAKLRSFIVPFFFCSLELGSGLARLILNLCKEFQEALSVFLKHLL